MKSDLPDPAPLSRTLTILNTRGLHARAAAKFVACAGKFDAHIVVSREGNAVEGTSIMGLLMLGAGFGTEIEVQAEGAEAELALDALTALVRDIFDES